jgi:WD40 repeat protein/tRNA A-37 threonylcarbamoyl transferase component Bud32
MPGDDPVVDLRPGHPVPEASSLSEASTVAWRGAAPTLEAALEEFELAWRRGERPSVDHFLPSEPSLRHAALVDLVNIDLELRLKAGEPARAEDYLLRFPDLAGDREAAHALIDTEHELRRRFPQFWSGGPTEHSHAAGDPALPWVPGFEIVGVLGRGGMGVVYKARQPALKRFVALKMVLSGRHTDAEERARFRREVEAGARLMHPNVVQVFEVGEVRGAPYVALELVEGGSLDARLRQAPLAPRDAAALVEVISRAVQFAHEHGVVHRDLKPANVLLTADGTPKVGDFGLAKRLDDQSAHTRTGALMGTPSYMAPEQAAGRWQDVGPAADVYALGAILYECLAGRPPFKGATPLETAGQVLTEDPVRLSRLQPGVPRDLETICFECLRKEPTRRYRSAAALADDLARFLAGEPIRARAVSRAERAVKWARRRPLAASLLLVTLLATLGLLAGVFWHTAELRVERDKVHLREIEVRGQTREVQRQRDLVADRERLVHQHEYALDIARAHACWERGDTANALSLLLRHAPATGQDDLRGFEWHYLQALVHSSDPWTLTSHPRGASSVRFSPDGHTLATAGGDASVQLWALPGRTRRALVADLPSAVEHLAFSGGNHLLTVDRGGVRLRDALTGKEQSAWQLPPGRIARTTLSADGKHLGLWRSGHGVELYEAATGQKIDRRRAGRPGHPIDCMVILAGGKRVIFAKEGYLEHWDVGTGKGWGGSNFSARAVALVASEDGQILAVIDTTGRIVLYDLAGGRSLPTLPATLTGAARCAAFAPGGKLLASGGADNTVRLYDTATGHLRKIFRGHAGPIEALSFSPDGRSLASASEDGAVKLWDLQQRQDNRPLLPRLLPRGPFAYSGDGKALAFVPVSGPIPLLDTATGEVRLLPGEPAEVIHALALSRAGRLLATAGDGPAILLRDTAGGAVRATFQHPPQAGLLAFSPDERWLVSAGRGASTRFWDVAERREGRPLPAPPRDVTVLAFAPDGRTLATSDGGRTVALWDLLTGKAGATFEEKAPVTHLAFSHDGQKLAAGCQGGAAVHTGGPGRWSTGTWHPTGAQFLGFFPDDQTLATFDAFTVHLRDLKGQDRQHMQVSLVTAVCSPAGTSLALFERDGALRLWRRGARGLLHPEGLRLAPVDALVFSPDGKALLTGSREEPHTVRRWQRYGALPLQSIHHRHETGPCPEVRFWAARTGTELPTLPGQETRGATLLALTPDGRTLVSAGEGGVLWVRDVAGRRRARHFFVNDAASKEWTTWEVGSWSPWGMAPSFHESVRALAVSPDGRTLATVSGRGEVALWDLPGGGKRLSLPAGQDEPAAVAFAPDSRTLAVNHGRDVRLWDLSAEGGPRLLRTLTGHSRPIRCLAFAPKGQLLAGGGEDRRVMLWDLEHNRETALISHTDTVQTLAFAPDARTLASGGADGLVKLWHVRTGHELLTLSGHSGPVRCVAFSPDGKTLASGGITPLGVGEAYLWQARP